METLADRLKKIRSEKGMSQSQVARAASISNEYVGKIERGEVTNIGTEIIESIAKVFDIHPSEILYGYSEKKLHEISGGTAKFGSKYFDLIKKLKGKPLPVIGVASCGGWKDFADLQYPSHHAQEWLEGISKDPEAFYVIAHGDSMIDADIKEGDYLLIEPNSRVTNGCKVLAQEPKLGCTIKLFYKEKDIVRLQPMNTKYAPVFIENGEDFKVYKVAGKFTKY